MNRKIICTLITSGLLFSFVSGCTKPVSNQEVSKKETASVQDPSPEPSEKPVWTVQVPEEPGTMPDMIQQLYERAVTEGALNRTSIPVAWLGEKDLPVDTAYHFFLLYEPEKKETAPLQIAFLTQSAKDGSVTAELSSFDLLSYVKEEAAGKEEQYRNESGTVSSFSLPQKNFADLQEALESEPDLQASDYTPVSLLGSFTDGSQKAYLCYESGFPHGNGAVQHYTVLTIGKEADEKYTLVSKHCIDLNDFLKEEA
jgi:hypothetical protein